MTWNTLDLGILYIMIYNHKSFKLIVNHLQG
jgi:hypothetical protein